MLGGEGFSASLLTAFCSTVGGGFGGETRLAPHPDPAPDPLVQNAAGHRQKMTKTKLTENHPPQSWNSFFRS